MKISPQLQSAIGKFARWMENENSFRISLRALLAFSAGVIILLKPAFALRLCGALFPAAALAAAAYLHTRTVPWLRPVVWLLPAGALAIRLIPRNGDAAALLFIILTVSAIVLRSFRRKTLIDRLTAFTAAAFALMLLYRMFQAEWFDLYTAAAPAFWGAGLWELSCIKRR